MLRNDGVRAEDALPNRCPNSPLQQSRESGPDGRRYAALAAESEAVLERRLPRDDVGNKENGVACQRKAKEAGLQASMYAHVYLEGQLGAAVQVRVLLEECGLQP